MNVLGSLALNLSGGGLLSGSLAGCAPSPFWWEGSSPSSTPYPRQASEPPAMLRSLVVLALFPLSRPPGCISQIPVAALAMLGSREVGFAGLAIGWVFVTRAVAIAVAAKPQAGRWVGAGDWPPA